METLDLYTNRNARKDFVVNAIEALTSSPCNVYIAVAFFTDASVIERLVKIGCRVRLVVRLGYPTLPDALVRLMGTPAVEIRYFTDNAFHPKVYIFGNTAALVGSANLTQAAIKSNQEVVVLLGSEDSRLDELAILFAGYWSQANVLTPSVLKDYRAICAQYGHLRREQQKLDQEVIDKLGRVYAGDVIQDKSNKSKENIFLEAFRKTYQECVNAFNIVRNIYEGIGRRKAPAAAIPIRLEMDSFVSFVRERYAREDTWRNAPMRSALEQRTLIEPMVAEWLVTPWPHFDSDIVLHMYPRLIAVFSTPESIASASDHELFDALCTAHSFHDRLRFFLGGLPAWRTKFVAANSPSRLRSSLQYLIHGPGKAEERIANVIYSSTYKLNEFGTANVQELVGWCNKEELPVINGRTAKVLRWFGSDVAQLGNS
jgi:hypothetical protein